MHPENKKLKKYPCTFSTSQPVIFNRLAAETLSADVDIQLEHWKHHEFAKTD